MLRRVKFYRHLLHNCGVFLCDVFLMFFLDNFKSDCMLSQWSEDLGRPDEMT